ncbi:MAG: hypothetical protein PHF13_03710 [Acholeplasmataceae bacterium]|nr:hypothetical protein [Acholeplasmataceae bacterium]
MYLKTKVLVVGATLAGTIGKAVAAGNESISLTPDAKKGMENLAELPYVDKLQWILDTVYALVPYMAVLALGILAIKYYTGGWDSVENELRTRKAFFAIILIVLMLKVGSSFIRLISDW